MNKYFHVTWLTQIGFTRQSALWWNTAIFTEAHMKQVWTKSILTHAAGRGSELEGRHKTASKKTRSFHVVKRDFCHWSWHRNKRENSEQHEPADGRGKCAAKHKGKRAGRRGDVVTPHRTPMVTTASSRGRGCR